MSSIGLFDVKGLTAPDPSMQIVSPLFDKVTISLNKDYYKGEKFVIRSKGNSDRNMYIKSMRLNGKDWGTVQLPWSCLTEGGELEIEMSDVPDTGLTR